MTVLFDTRAYHRTLTDAGVPGEQADAHMRALELALEGGVATKQDVMSLEQKLEIGFRDQKIWTGGVGVVLVGAGLAVAKLLWT